MSLEAELSWPMMLGAATAAKVRLIVRCESCGHQVEPYPAEMAARYGAGASVLDWRTSSRAPASGSPSIRAEGPRSSAAQCVNTAEAVDLIGFHLFLPSDCSRRSVFGRLPAVGGHAASLANFPI